LRHARFFRHCKRRLRRSYHSVNTTYRLVYNILNYNRRAERCPIPSLQTAGGYTKTAQVQMFSKLKYIGRVLYWLHQLLVAGLSGSLR